MQAANLEARMNNPVMVVPDTLRPLLDLAEATRKAGLPPITADLVHLRAAQINGCGYCVDMHSRDLKKAGETDERIFSVAAWREAPYYTEAERAALALAEAATRLSDRPDPCPTGSSRRPPGTTTSRRSRPDHRYRPDQLLEPPHRHREAAGGLYPG
jgi:AhpD family alkylhydroperoxidase